MNGVVVDGRRMTVLPVARALRMQRKIPGRNDERRAQRLEFEQALLVGEKRKMRFRPLWRDPLPQAPAVIIKGLETPQDLDRKGLGEGRSLFHRQQPGGFVGTIE
jgi:hypothetical protein